MGWIYFETVLNFVYKYVLTQNIFLKTNIDLMSLAQRILFFTGRVLNDRFALISGISHYHIYFETPYL